MASRVLPSASVDDLYDRISIRTCNVSLDIYIDISSVINGIIIAYSFIAVAVVRCCACVRTYVNIKVHELIQCPLQSQTTLSFLLTTTSTWHMSVPKKR